MKSLEEFESFYNNDLLKQLQEIEKIRKERVKQGIVFVVGIILTIWIVHIIKINNYISTEYDWLEYVLYGVGVIITLILSLGNQKYKESYRGVFKDRIIRPIINTISEDLTYQPNGFISRDDFSKSRLFLNRIDKYSGDDLVEGKIDKTMIHFSELHAQQKQVSGSGKDRREKWVTIFKGLFFVADFNKDFEGSTVLIPNRIGKGMSFLKKMMGANRLEKLVKLEDPEFAKNFNCYSSDDIKARYVLSPGLMHRINQFLKKYPKNSVYISFVDSHLYVAIYTGKDFFEPSYFKSVVNFDMIKSYFEDVKFVVDIVEEFNLNNRIWTKE